MKRALIFSVLLFLPASLVLLGALPAAGEAPTLLYEVDLTRPETGVVGVSLRLQAASSPLVLEMRDSWGNGLAVDLASHVMNEAAADASGSPLPVRRDGNTWYVEGTGEVSFTYEVDTAGYRAGTDYLDSLVRGGTPWPYFPLLAADLAYLPGYAVFVYPGGGSSYQPRLELAVPAQWKLALPWTDAPADLEGLLNDPVFAGDLAVEERGSLVVAMPSSSASAGGLAEYADKIQSLRAETERLLGGLGIPDGERLLVAALFRGEGTRRAGPFYPSSPFAAAVALSAPAAADVLSDASIEAAANGIADMWLAREIAVEEEALWIREGSARYLQHLIPYRTGTWGAQVFWDRFYRTYDVYREARGNSQTSIAASGSAAAEDADAAALLCAGGASACAALDAELQSLQPVAMDLPSFLRDLAGMKDGGAPHANADILSMLRNSTGRDWTSFFENHIGGAEEIPASSFSSLDVAGIERTDQSAEPPDASASTSDWIVIAVTVFAVFLVPFLLEPYTMRPRKPGFLERELAKDDED